MLERREPLRRSGSARDARIGVLSGGPCRLRDRMLECHVQRRHEFIDLDRLGQIAEKSRLQAASRCRAGWHWRSGRPPGCARWPGRSRRICIASMPLMPGRLMSIRITSGSAACASSMPRGPSIAVSRRMSGRRAMSCATSLQVGRVVFDVEQRARARAPVSIGFERQRGGHESTPAANGGVAAAISSNQNTLPAPTVLSTPITPPINSTSRLVTTRPMPVPSSALDSWPSRLNGWNSCAELFRRQSQRRCPGC